MVLTGNIISANARAVRRKRNSVKEFLRLSPVKEPYGVEDFLRNDQEYFTGKEDRSSQETAVALKNS